MQFVKYIGMAGMVLNCYSIYYSSIDMVYVLRDVTVTKTSLHIIKFIPIVNLYNSTVFI